MIDWNKTTKGDALIIIDIARRAIKMLGGKLIDVEMDITACHITCPLRLNDLLKADGGSFAHDICGIQKHLDRETGELKDCFTPRFAV